MIASRYKKSTTSGGKCYRMISFFSSTRCSMMNDSDDLMTAEWFLIKEYCDVCVSDEPASQNKPLASII
jgi:hypothetical protein